jgi:polysaccharide biosynthesis transport protein
MASLIPAEFEERPNGNGSLPANGRDVVSEFQARAMMEDGEPPPVDFLGPILRRKSIIILLAMVGSVIGFFLYRRESPVYQSVLRIMISTRIPPSVVVHGEGTIQQVSLPRQQTLVASEPVLSQAIEKGKLAELECFRGHPSPLASLRGMFTVKPLANATDTLDLICRGPNPEDLPAILTAILDSYNNVLHEDTLGNSAEQQRLIEDLTLRVTEDKDNAEKRYYELMSELRLTADEASTGFNNPFLERLERTKAEVERLRDESDKVVYLLRGIDRIASMPDSEKASNLKMLAHQAERYLQLGTVASTPAELVERQESIKRMQLKIDSINDTIMDYERKRNSIERSFGVNHPTSIKLINEMESFRSQQVQLQENLDRLREMSANENGEDSPENRPSRRGPLSAWQEESVKLYKLTLEAEKSKFDSAMQTKQEEYDALANEEAANRQKMNELYGLRAQITKKETTVQEILEKLSALSVTSSFDTTSVKMIEPPRNGVKVAPSLTNFLLLSLLIGGLIGAGLAFLVDRADMTFRNPYEIFQRMRVPVICKVPNISKSKVKHNLPCVHTLVTAIEPRSAAAEAFRACRTAMLFFANHSGAKTYLLSSPSAGDGKSTTVSNLAVSIAQTGKRVCLVDCDLRRPRQHKYFGVEMKPGLADYVEGDQPIEQVIRPTFQQNLSIITSGGHPDNPGEFVVAPKFQQLLAKLKQEYDVVLIDSPPLLPVADATSLSTQVDGVLLVFRIRKGVVLASAKARELLDMVHARMLGIIVNGVDQNPYYSEYGGYGSPYYYSGNSYGVDRYYERQVKEYAESSSSK